MKHVALVSWGSDQHDLGCSCGLCNSASKSYGVAIVALPKGHADWGEESLQALLSTFEPEKVVYAASEEAARRNAQLYCLREGSFIGQDYVTTQAIPDEIRDKPEERKEWLVTYVGLEARIVVQATDEEEALEKAQDTPLNKWEVLYDLSEISVIGVQKWYQEINSEE